MKENEVTAIIKEKTDAIKNAYKDGGKVYMLI